MKKILTSALAAMMLAGCTSTPTETATDAKPRRDDMIQYMD